MGPPAHRPPWAFHVRLPVGGPRWRPRSGRRLPVLALTRQGDGKQQQQRHRGSVHPHERYDNAKTEVPMKGGLVLTLGVAAVCAVVLVSLAAQSSSSGTRSRPLVSEAQYETWQTQLSNWGRWGPDDQLGTLNLI